MRLQFGLSCSGRGENTVCFSNAICGLQLHSSKGTVAGRISTPLSFLLSLYFIYISPFPCSSCSGSPFSPFSLSPSSYLSPPSFISISLPHAFYSPLRNLSGVFSLFSLLLSFLLLSLFSSSFPSTFPLGCHVFPIFPL